MLFAYLSDSDNVTSIYEMYPSAGSRSIGKLQAALRDEIRSYNGKILAYSSDQIIELFHPPISRA